MRWNIAHIISNRKDQTFRSHVYPIFKKKKERTRSFPREIDRLVEIFDGTGSSTSKRGPVKYRLGVARVSACQRVARVPAPEGLKEFVDCTRVICASTSTKWLSRLFFQTSRVSPSVRSPPSIFPFVGLRRRAEERRGFSSEGAVSLTGRPRGGFAIRGATRSFAVLSRKRSEAAFKARSNNWSGRKGTIVLERSFKRKFEFRFERIVSLSRRDPYLNADFARFSTVISLLFARERVNDESGSFFALGEIFFDEPGYFLRFSTLCRSMMILPLKFKWTKSTWDERGGEGGGERDRIIPPIDPLPSLGFLLGWKTEERDGRNSCGISVLFPRFTSPLSRSLRNTREAISREGEGGGEGITTVSEVSSGLAVRRIGGKAIGGILDRGEARILDEITWPLCPSAP